MGILKLCCYTCGLDFSQIESGRATFHVKHEFEVSLTVMGDGPNIPWKLLNVEILVEDKDCGGNL